MTVIAAAVAALSLVVAVWLAALIVGLVLFAAAGIALLISRKQIEHVTPPAERTVDNVKQDIETIKEARNDRQ
jgi:hypothetical protein